MKKYKAPYSEVIRFGEDDIVVTSGLENIGQENGANENGEIVEDSDDFDW